MDPTTPPQSARPHWAARLEDSLAARVNAVLRRRGWVPRVEPHTGYGAPGWVRVLGRTMLAAPGTRGEEAAERDPGSRRRAVRGWRSFLTAQLPHTPVVVRVGGTVTEVVSDRGGYVDVVVRADLEPGWREVTLEAGGAATTAPVLVVDPEVGTGMVSDIDDTVMVTMLPRPLLAAWNALVLHENARRVVPGMAGLYRRWEQANPGAPTFYLSTGAWNVAPALRRFLGRHGYPPGPLLLTDWGPTNTGWFRSGREHKDRTLRRLAADLPGVRWFLVGDDGQHDPEIYDAFAAEHPGAVHAIAVRQLSPAEQVLAHGTTEPMDDRMPGHGDVPVVAGSDGNALALQMIDRGMLPAGPPGEADEPRRRRRTARRR